MTDNKPTQEEVEQAKERLRTIISASIVKRAITLNAVKIADDIKTILASHSDLTARLAEADRNFCTLRDAKIAQNHVVDKLEKERDSLKR